MSKHPHSGSAVIASIHREVTHLVPSARGGICRHAAALASDLEQAGWTCRIAGPSMTLERMCEFGLPSTILKFPTDQVSSRAPAILSTLRRVASLRGSAALFHAHGYRAALDATIARLRPLVVTAHNLPPDRGALAAIFALRRADAIIAVSAGVFQALIDRGVPSEKVIVAPNGIDLCPLPSRTDVLRARAAVAPYFDSSLANVSFLAEHSRKEPAQVIPDRTIKEGDPAGSALILAIGRLSREKGFDVLLDSLEQVLRVQTDAHLLLVGSGPERRALEERVPLSIRHRVALIGEVADARRLMPAADVVVIPSRAEGQSLVALEALNAGVRTVASDVGGLPEMIRPGITGWLARPGDPGDLARAILEALASPSDQFTAAGRKVLAEEFNPGQSLRRVLALYEELIPNRNRS